jgi:hypothetical protein
MALIKKYPTTIYELKEKYPKAFDYLLKKLPLAISIKNGIVQLGFFYHSQLHYDFYDIELLEEKL